MTPPVIMSSVEAYVKALLHCYKYPTQPIMGFLIGKYLNPHSSMTHRSESSSSELTGQTIVSITEADQSTSVSHTTESNEQENQNSNNTNNNCNNENITDHSQERVQTQNESFGPHSCYVTDAVPLFHTLPMTYPHPMVDVAIAHTMSLAKTNGLSLLGVYIANERCDDRTLSPLLRPLLEAIQNRLSDKHKLLLWFVDNQTLQSPPSSLSICTLYYPGSYIIEKAIALPTPSLSTLANHTPRQAAYTNQRSSNSRKEEDNMADSNNNNNNNDDDDNNNDDNDDDKGSNNIENEKEESQSQLTEDMATISVDAKGKKANKNAQNRYTRRNKISGSKKGKVNFNSNKNRSYDDYGDDNNDNDDEYTGEDSIMLDLWFGQWNSATLLPERNTSLEGAIEATSNALNAFAHYRIIDFEEHLENPRLNYLVQPLEQLMHK